MPSSEAVEDIKVDKTTSFTSAIAKEGNSASMYRLGQRGGKGLKKEEGVIDGCDSPDTTSMVREIGVHRPEKHVALEIVLQVADEGCSPFWWQAVLL